MKHFNEETTAKNKSCTLYEQGDNKPGWILGTIWTAEDPEPITPTRFP